MKKIVLLCLVVFSACELKAQQLLPLKPADTALQFYKPLPVLAGNSIQLNLQKLNFYQPLQNVALQQVAVNTDRMPVAVLEGNSKMPVIKPGGFYTMPVIRPGSTEIMPLQQSILPGLPAIDQH